MKLCDINMRYLDKKILLSFRDPSRESLSLIPHSRLSQNPVDAQTIFMKF